MKKVRRILAIIGIVILVVLYLCTLFTAIFDSSNTMGFFKASVAMTILVPVIIYAMTMFARILRPDEEIMKMQENAEEEKEE